MKQKSLSENYYQSLLISLQHVRNRTIFFTLFCIYALLNVLATTDKNIYMLDAIKMPLLGIELPLIAFSIVIPLFLIALQFNLLYNMYGHKQLLFKAYKQNEKDVKSLPSGLFEGALLYSDSNFFYKMIRFFIYVIIFVLPLATLIAFYLRFSDYQSFGLSSWHLALIVASFILMFIFREILEFGDSKKRKIIKLLRCLFVIFAIGLFTTYHYKIVYRITKQEFTNKDIEYFKNLELNELLFPSLKISGEVLVPYNKELLELLANLDKSNNTKLLLKSPLFNQSNKNFRFAVFENCVMVRTNFNMSNLQYAYFRGTNLQSATLNRTNLQNASLYEANMQDIYLFYTKLQYADLSKANLEGAYLFQVNLIGAELYEANLQGAYIENANMQGAFLQKVNMQGVIFGGGNLQGADLSGAKLQGTHFYGTNFKSVNIDNIDNTPLNKKDAKKLINIIKNNKYYSVTKSKYKMLIVPSLINSAIDKEPKVWIKEQRIITGELTKKEIEKICKEFIIDNDETKDAKKRLGCDKIK
jgi:uncharacterized protein YjbI with pentapeptide repeats